MGNKDSKDAHHHHHSDSDDGVGMPVQKSKPSSELEDSYKRVFGPMLGPKLWRYVQLTPDTDTVPLEEFESKCTPLAFGHSDDVYLRILADEDGTFSAPGLAEAIHICRATAGVEFNGKSDEKLIEDIISTLTSGHEKARIDELGSWIEGTCPRLASSLKRTVAHGIKTAETRCDKWIGPKSSFLSPMKIWFIQCCVPSYLIKPETSSIADQLSNDFPTSAIWDRLYSSEEDGLSPNRFETKVFNYRSPTVMVVEFVNGDMYCVCVDEEWKYSTQRWGKAGCAVYRLHPRVELSESGGINGIIFFNTKQRGLPQGLVVGSNPKNPHFRIDPDFSNVRSIEVWGCGSPESYQAQQSHKQWEKRQIEKQQQVPLPGKWEDSPDRMLLEMAGIKVSHAEK